MNKLRYNPNRRLGLSAASIFLGGAMLLGACTPGESQPEPSPSPSATAPDVAPHVAPFDPRCAVRVASVRGKKVNFRIQGTELDEPGLYGVNHVDFNFGDGKRDDENGLGEDHTYSRAGTYTVGAVVVLEVVAPGAAGDAWPIRNGEQVPCTATTVTIR